MPPDETRATEVTAGVVTRSTTVVSPVLWSTTATVPAPMTAATRATAAVPAARREKRRGGSTGDMDTLLVAVAAVAPAPTWEPGDPDHQSVPG